MTPGIYVVTCVCMRCPSVCLSHSALSLALSPCMCRQMGMYSRRVWQNLVVLRNVMQISSGYSIRTHCVDLHEPGFEWILHMIGHRNLSPAMRNIFCRTAHGSQKKSCLLLSQSVQPSNFSSNLQNSNEFAYRWQIYVDIHPNQDARGPTCGEPLCGYNVLLSPKCKAVTCSSRPASCS